MKPVIQRYQEISDAELNQEERDLMKRHFSITDDLTSVKAELHTERHIRRQELDYEKIQQLNRRHVSLCKDRDNCERELYPLGAARFNIRPRPVCVECFSFYETGDDDYATCVRADCEHPMHD